MNEVPFEVILEQAEERYRAQKPWHFHILTPSCTFNESDVFVIIFENETSREKICSTFNDKPLKEGSQLEKLYGRV